MHLAALLLAACTAPEGDGADTAVLPGAWTYADTGPDAPALTAEGATAALQGVIDGAFGYNGAPPFAAYDEVRVWATETCPATVSDPSGGSLWDDDCTTPDGARFAGFLSEYNAVDPLTRRMSGEATVTAPGGEQLVMAGTVSMERIGEPPTWTSALEGVLRYDGPAAAGTWLETDVDLDYTAVVASADTGAVAMVSLDGSVGGLPGEVAAVDFDGFVVSAGGDWPCPEEPAGTVALRDARGVWAELTFDVTGDVGAWTVPDGACDGCGTLRLADEVSSAVCVDVGPLLDAGTPPW